MGFVGKEPAEAALTSDDITDGIIVDADINASAAIAMSKTAFSAGTGVTLSTNTLNVDAAQTGITSLLATNIKIGEDDQTKIDFEDDNKINFYANNAKEVELAENSLSPGTSDGTALGTTSLMWSDLFLADGSVINFNNGDVTLTHSSNTLTIAGGNLAATISTASQPNITTLAGVTAMGTVSNTLALTYGDITLFDDNNNADASFSIGTSATEALKIEVLNGSSNKTAEEVHFSTATASGTADHGKMVFDIDGTDILTIDDGGLVIKTTGTIGPVGDEDLITLTASGNIVTVAGELSVTTLDIGGTNITSTAAELNLLDGSAKSTSSITIADSDAFVVIDGSTTKQIPASDIKSYASGGGTFDAVADGAISAGDLVGIDANGKVSTLTGSFNGGTGATSVTELIGDTTGDAINGRFNVVWDPDNSRGIMVWDEASSSYDLIGVVLTKNADGTISAATEQIIHNGSSSSYSQRSAQLVYDTNVDRFVIVFSLATSNTVDFAIKGMILDIDPSDNSIDTGTPIVIDGADGSGFGSIAGGAIQRGRGKRTMVFMPSSNHIALWLTHDRYDSGGNYITADGATKAGARLTIMTAVGGSTNSLTVNSSTRVTDWKNAEGLAWDANASRLFALVQDGTGGDDISYYIIEHDTSDDSITASSIVDVDDNPSGSTRCHGDVIYWASAQKVFVMWSVGSGSGGFYTKIRGYTVASSGQSATASSETTTLRSEEQGDPYATDMAELTTGNFANHLAVVYKDYGGTTRYWELFTYDSSNVGVDDAYNGSATFSSVDTTGIFTDGETFSIISLAQDDASDFDYITPSVAPATSSAKHYSRWCGIANSAISDTATGTITSIGGVGTGQSSLTPGTWYQVDNTGSLATLSNSYSDASYAKVGFATSATTIFITGGMSD